MYAFTPSVNAWILALVVASRFVTSTSSMRCRSRVMNTVRICVSWETPLDPISEESLPRANPPEQIHLEQPVLRLDVTLHGVAVVLVGAEDVRDVVLVVGDVHVPRQSRESRARVAPAAAGR